MLIKGITDEDFINYKVPSMYIATATCSFKCDKEYGHQICQNSELVKQPTHNVDELDIVSRYISNPITKAIVFGGLEPIDSPFDLFWLINLFRTETKDDIVIYTGYTKEELQNMDIQYPNAHTVNMFSSLQFFKNIVIKFGRYIPNQQPHYDPVLGVYLASDNQYAERIS